MEELIAKMPSSFPEEILYLIKPFIAVSLSLAETVLTMAPTLWLSGMVALSCDFERSPRVCGSFPPLQLFEQLLGMKVEGFPYLCSDSDQRSSDSGQMSGELLLKSTLYDCLT